MAKKLIQSVKGTRDFYPENMAFRNWLFGKIKCISEQFGYQEFDGPNLEYLELYSDKTSEEILKEQAFTLQDKDNRTLILRPEITPTFARMVAQRAQQLPKPIRWYSFSKAWRYEQPQKGRGREFFQWEINILGPETPEADAEILAIAAQYLKELGLTPQEVFIRVSDRSYFEQVLRDNKISNDLYMPLLRIIDRIEKISEEEFIKELSKLNLTPEQIDGVKDYINNKSEIKSEWLQKVFKTLELFDGAKEYIVYDPVIARGFDYYTRTVFEAWDKTGNMKRALFGGGRFDNLTETLGGERVPGVGMAPGDMPIQSLLETLGKLPSLKPITAKALITTFNEELQEQSFKLANLLRINGLSVETWPDSSSKIEKQLKYANQKEIEYVVIIGPDEAVNNSVVLKNMKTGEQEKLSIEDAMKRLL